MADQSANSRASTSGKTLGNVVVIGGGPAGSTAATFSRTGLQGHAV